MNHRLTKIERTLKLQWIAIVALGLLCFGCLFARGNEQQLALQHRAQFAAAEHPYLFYFTAHSFPEDQRTALAQAAAFAFAGSSSQEIVEHCTPQPIGGNLYLIDLREIKWDWRQFWKVFESYPYRTTYVSGGSYAKWAPQVVLRMDWLMIQLLDTVQSDTHYRLLYNDEKIDRNGYLKFWKVNEDPAVHYATPEGKSGVSRIKKRWIISQGNALRTFSYGTLDFLRITVDDKGRQRDPLERLEYPLKDRFDIPNHDGEEWITGMPKWSLETHEFGALQSYFLADGAGKRIELATGELVEGDSSFRGKPYGDITNNGGCINCHKTGLNAPTTNEAIALLKNGGIISSKDKNTALDIERLVFRSPTKEVEFSRGLYAAGTQMICGMEPAAAVANVLACVNYYDADVTLEQAARELYTEPDELAFALGWYSSLYSMPARLVSLGQGLAVPREKWEEYYYAAYLAMKAWEKATG